MSNKTPRFRVTGVAPGHSLLNGKTFELGLCYSEEEATRCQAFWYRHYDDIQVHEICTQNKPDESE